MREHTYQYTQMKHVAIQDKFLKELHHLSLRPAQNLRDSGDTNKKISLLSTSGKCEMQVNDGKILFIGSPKNIDLSKLNPIAVNYDPGNHIEYVSVESGDDGYIRLVAHGDGIGAFNIKEEARNQSNRLILFEFQYQKIYQYTPVGGLENLYIELNDDCSFGINYLKTQLFPPGRNYRINNASWHQWHMTLLSSRRAKNVVRLSPEYLTEEKENDDPPIRKIYRIVVKEINQDSTFKNPQEDRVTRGAIADIRLKVKVDGSELRQDKKEDNTTLPDNAKIFIGLKGRKSYNLKITHMTSAPDMEYAGRYAENYVEDGNRDNIHLWNVGPWSSNTTGKGDHPQDSGITVWAFDMVQKSLSLEWLDRHVALYFAIENQDALLGGVQIKPVTRRFINGKKLAPYVWGCLKTWTVEWAPWPENFEFDDIEKLLRNHETGLITMGNRRNYNREINNRTYDEQDRIRAKDKYIDDLNAIPESDNLGFDYKDEIKTEENELNQHIVGTNIHVHRWLSDYFKNQHWTALGQDEVTECVNSQDPAEHQDHAGYREISWE